MLSDAEIFDKVKDALVDALGVDDDEVTPTATLGGDLGAESIDYLDIFFKLDKSCGAKIAKNEFIPDALMDENSGYVKDGSITPEGIAALRQLAPHFDADKLAANPKVSALRDLATVDTLCKLVKNKLSAA